MREMKIIVTIITAILALFCVWHLLFKLIFGSKLAKNIIPFLS